ncbi:MAG: HAD-IIIA family hydrolase [Dehalococcoidia bacterium]
MAAVLLDRDGVINKNRVDYVKRWDEFEFLPGALEALATMRAAGLRLAVVTNQSAVGRGLLASHRLREIHRRMLVLCAANGGAIEGVFACEHAPWAGCGCRKPQPGLLRRATAALGEPPERCVFIGDAPEDLLAARAARVPFVLVRTGRGEETLRHAAYRETPPLYVARSLTDAASAVRSRFAARTEPVAA